MNLKEFKKELIQQIQELEEQIASMKEAAQPVELDHSTVGRLSRMDALAAQAVNKRTYEMAKGRLGNMKRLLEECDKEDFNLCIECEEPINLKRLLSVPGSKYCINCAKNI